MSLVVVNVAKDFSRFPAGRFRRHGKYSGEVFREQFLIPAVTKKQRLLVELDGTLGYGSSFLEEAFGGLMRVTGAAPEDVMTLIQLKSDDTSLVQEIQDYIRHGAE